ncbi:MAG: hypothetical protein MUO88_01215, partial [Desulfobacterales bacterium]|nr:hypothetical protein [Desulfobacterales bacterium]
CFFHSNASKKILKHLDLWDVRRKTRPLICFPHTTSSRGPARMITSGFRITLPKPTFNKNLKLEDRPSISKTRYFQPI